MMKISLHFAETIMIAMEYMPRIISNFFIFNSHFLMASTCRRRKKNENSIVVFGSFVIACARPWIVIVILVVIIIIIFIWIFAQQKSGVLVLSETYNGMHAAFIETQRQWNYNEIYFSIKTYNLWIRRNFKTKLF